LIAGGEPIYSAGTAYPSGFWLIRVALFKSYMFSIWNCVCLFYFIFHGSAVFYWYIAFGHIMSWYLLTLLTKVKVL